MYFKRTLYTTGEVARGFGVNEDQVNNWIDQGWLKAHPASHLNWKRVHYSNLLEFSSTHRLTLSLEKLEDAEPKVLSVGKIEFIPRCRVYTAQRLTEVAEVLCHHVFDVVALDHLHVDRLHICLITRELVADPFHGQPRIVHIVKKSNRRSSPRSGQSVIVTAPLDLHDLSKLCHEEYRRELV